MEPGRPAIRDAPTNPAATPSNSERRPTRRGERFLDPRQVQLHSKDFAFDELVAARGLTEAPSSGAAPPATAASALSGEALAAHYVAQGAAWEKHYVQSQGNFFAVKNYLFRAFPLLLPHLAEGASDSGGRDDETASDASASPANMCRTQRKRPRSEVVDAADARDGDPAPVSVPEQSGLPMRPAEAAARTIVECGCGTGSALLPLIRLCPQDRFVAFDVSPTAVSLLWNHAEAAACRAERRLECFPYDIAASDDAPPLPMPSCTADVVLLVFVLSALSQDRMVPALRRLAALLRPATVDGRDDGGVLCFRDYGALDHNYFRFADLGNAVAQGSFVKGDGTQQRFFSLAETTEMFTAAGMEACKLEYHCNRVRNRDNGKEMNKVFVNGTFRLASPAPVA